MKLETIRLPSRFSGVLHVWRRNYLHFRRFWLMNFFWIVLEPLLLLLAVGYGLGTYISNVQGVAFVDFFFPSVLCMSSMFVAYFESTYGNFAKLTYQNIYSTMVLTPLGPKQVVLGEILWAATKGTLSAVTVSCIAGIFGHLDNLMFFPVLLIIFLHSVLFASIGLCVAASMKKYDGILYPTSGFIVPMSLFCGTYFPLNLLPFGLKYLIYLFPLTHSVSLARGLLLDGITWWQVALHLIYLSGLTWILVRWAMKKVRNRLIG